MCQFEKFAHVLLKDPVMLLAFWRKLKGFCLWSIEHYCAPKLWGWGGWGGGVRPCNGQTGKLCVRLTGSQHGRQMLCVVRGQAWYVCIDLYCTVEASLRSCVHIALSRGSVFSKDMYRKDLHSGNCSGRDVLLRIESRNTGGTAARIDGLY